MKKIILLITCLFALNSCVTENLPIKTSYKKAFDGDVALGNNRYSISFSGNAFTPAEKLKEYFDIRASEICSLTENFLIIEQDERILKVVDKADYGWKEGIGAELQISGVIECQ